MTWFWVALICAISLALADGLTKKYFSSFTGLSILMFRLGLPGLVLLPFTILAGIPELPVEFWYLILVLIPLEIIAMWLYVLAIRDSPLHLSLPYFAFTPVFVILTGYLFLNEKVTWDGALGIVLIVAGTYVLNIERVRYSWSGLLKPFSAVFKLRGSMYMLSAALIYSFTAVLSKKAMLYTDPERFGALYFSLIGVATLTLILMVRPAVIKRIFEKPMAISMVSVLMAIMVVTHFIALSMVETAYMLSVKRTSMIFGMLLGAWMFRDMSYKQHLPAGLVMLTGVLLILI